MASFEIIFSHGIQGKQKLNVSFVHGYGIIEDPEDELVEVTKSDWYAAVRKTIAPGENLRIYREMHGMTQDQLADKLGNVTRQNVSNMENGHRSIGKNMAKKLAEMFDVSVEKFLRWPSPATPCPSMNAKTQR